MKRRETCTCGAELDVDHDDPAAIRDIFERWRETHRCMGPQAWRRSTHSTTGAQIEFGFSYRDDEVRV